MSRFARGIVELPKEALLRRHGRNDAFLSSQGSGMSAEGTRRLLRNSTWRSAGDVHSLNAEKGRRREESRTQRYRRLNQTLDARRRLSPRNESRRFSRWKQGRKSVFFAELHFRIVVVFVAKKRHFHHLKMLRVDLESGSRLLRLSFDDLFVVVVVVVAVVSGVFHFSVVVQYERSLSL